MLTPPGAPQRPSCIPSRSLSLEVGNTLEDIIELFPQGLGGRPGCGAIHPTLEIINSLLDS